jgi:hypothetical protein
MVSHDLLRTDLEILRSHVEELRIKGPGDQRGNLAAAAA